MRGVERNVRNDHGTSRILEQSCLYLLRQIVNAALHGTGIYLQLFHLFHLAFGK